jgi:metallo-beta-lactamase family protein
MKIQFFGGAQTVTGSQHLLKANGKRILLECGLFQGRRSETYEKNLNFDHNPADVDALLLSHAHIDHSGNIPNLYKNGFDKHIYTTAATVDLCQIMLRDSAYLNQKDVEWVNKRRSQNHEKPLEPLYSIEDVEGAMGHFVGVQYNRPYEVVPGARATFQDAGHILGSSSLLIEVEDRGETRRVGFSGDVGRRDQPILRDPQPLADLDILIMESTYGDRMHQDDHDGSDDLAEVVNKVIGRGGKLIIPAFAVGRTQTVLYILHRLVEQDLIPQVPIYVDSPMACNAIDVFRSHPENFDRETYEHFLNNHEDPFAPPGFACVRHADASKRLNEIDDPMIVIAASGMAEGGRVLHHLRNNIGDTKTMVLFVGFAAPNTLARKLMDGHKQVRIFGEEHDVRAEIDYLPHFSGHADRAGLLEFAKATPPDKLDKIFLVHGEVDQAQALKKALHEEGYKTVHIPAPGEEYNI